MGKWVWIIPTKPPGPIVTAEEVEEEDGAGTTKRRKVRRGG
jgi:hypothetical protein